MSGPHRTQPPPPARVRHRVGPWPLQIEDQTYCDLARRLRVPETGVTSWFDEGRRC
ncbi:hypothetical protein Nm8I071_13670 [Nonomuraea sp. TT08I-71]|nr:hypothetical protein Nm8I071_13670 [Nonomuraea sp. TT08I-71]